MQNPLKKQLVFIVIFAAVGFLAMQIPVARLAGSKATFTVFDAFAPITGSFIGTLPGIIAVTLMEIANFVIHGANIQDAGTVIRFFPVLFGVAVFARKTRFNLAIPLLAIGAFLAHPTGQAVWYFALLWTIPLVAHVFRDRFLFARAAGATFTAHAVGGALWMWTFSLPAAVWHSLIPVVLMERLAMSLGMCASFLLVTNLIAWIEHVTQRSFGFSLDPLRLIPALRAHVPKTS